MSLSLLTEAPGAPAALFTLQYDLDKLRRHLQDTCERFASIPRLAPEWKGQAQKAFRTSHLKAQAQVDSTESGFIDGVEAIGRYLECLEDTHRDIALLEEEAQEAFSRLNSVSAREYDAAYRAYERKLEGLRAQARALLDRLDECGQTQAAILWEALHNEPDSWGENGLNHGDRKPLTEADVRRIMKDLESLDMSKVDQGEIGDCYMLATLAGVLNSPEGRAFVRKQIEPHYGRNGKIDGFFVTLYDRHFLTGEVTTRKVLVRDVYTHGVGERHVMGKHVTYVPSIGSLYETAYGQIHPGGTRLSYIQRGIKGGFHADAYEAITGLSSVSVASENVGDMENREYAPLSKQEIINAVNNGQAVTTQTQLSGELKPHDGKQISTAHVYTVISADEENLTLRNPWGHNNETGEPKDGVFIISWDEYADRFVTTSWGEPLPPQSGS